MAVEVVTPTTLADLIEALSVDPVTGAQDSVGETVYRGFPNTAWVLEHSLFRLGPSASQIEAGLIHEFRKLEYRSFHQLPAEDVEWNWLAFGQHHGLPTRLLDWTFNPDVALHFATSDSSEATSDGAVWVANYVAVHNELPGVLKDVVDGIPNRLFTSPALASVCGDVSALDVLATPTAPILLFFEPFPFDDRFEVQQGLFCVMSDASELASDWLQASTTTCARKIVISAGLKLGLRQHLDRRDQTERRLFPGTDGTCRYLSRVYRARAN